MSVRGGFVWWWAALAVALVACGEGGGGTSPDAAMQDGGATDASGGDADGPDGARDAGSADAGRDGGSDGGPTDAGADAGCTVEVSWDSCNDGIDNDCDGETDTDPGCSVCPSTSERRTTETGFCDDGIDDDCDGLVDCADSDCQEDEACVQEGTNALCSDGIDNDGDERIDCLSRSCVDPEGTVTVCTASPIVDAEDAEALCGDRLDNDGDGYTDCDDHECAGMGFCAEMADEDFLADEDTVSCSDEEDNDGDGLIDCLDSNCRDDSHCMGESDDDACSDGTDNDHDGRIDCADPSCYRDPAVEVCFDATEDCSNGDDDDHDGLADCFDPSCETTCSAMDCSADNPVGTCSDAGMECGLGGVCGRPLSDFALDEERSLLITELMPDPVGLDADREFIEILNVSGGPVMIAGVTMEDGGGTTAIFSERMVLAEEERIILGANDDPDDNGDLDVVGVLPFRLDQDGDTMTLSFDGDVIHEVTYPGSGNDVSNTGQQAEESQSIQLDQAFLDGTTGAATWCLTPQDDPYEYHRDGQDANYGTPGRTNFSCP